MLLWMDIERYVGREDVLADSGIVYRQIKKTPEVNKHSDVDWKGQ
jgi:hypothetical protein